MRGREDKKAGPSKNIFLHFIPSISWSLVRLSESKWEKPVKIVSFVVKFVLL